MIHAGLFDVMQKNAKGSAFHATGAELIWIQVLPRRSDCETVLSCQSIHPCESRALFELLAPWKARWSNQRSWQIVEVAGLIREVRNLQLLYTHPLTSASSQPRQSAKELFTEKGTQRWCASQECVRSGLCTKNVGKYCKACCKISKPWSESIESNRSIEFASQVKHAKTTSPLNLSIQLKANQKK